jgi:hypothetical protein
LVFSFSRGKRGSDALDEPGSSARGWRGGFCAKISDYPPFDQPKVDETRGKKAVAKTFSRADRLG